MMHISFFCQFERIVSESQIHNFLSPKSHPRYEFIVSIIYYDTNHVPSWFRWFFLCSLPREFVILNTVTQNFLSKSAYSFCSHFLFLFSFFVFWWEMRIMNFTAWYPEVNNFLVNVMYIFPKHTENYWLRRNLIVGGEVFHLIYVIWVFEKYLLKISTSEDQPLTILS